MLPLIMETQDLFFAKNLQFILLDKTITNDIINGIGMDLAEIIVKAKFSKTKTEARRHITAGGIRLNDIKLFDPFARLAMAPDGHFLCIQRDQ